MEIKSRDTLKKTPFIWLLESYEQDDLPLDSSVDFSADLRLFFLDWANIPKWLTEDHTKYVTKPMRNLYELWKEVIEDDYSIKRYQGASIRPRNRFGVEVQNQGNKRKILDEDLSGLDMRTTLEVYDVSECVSGC